MRWTIRNQIFLPFACLLTASIVLVAFASVWTSARNIGRQKQHHLRQVVSALADTNFPVTPDIARRIASMIDGHVVAVDQQNRVVASTLPPGSGDVPPPLLRIATAPAAQHSQVVRIQQQSYLVTVIVRNQAPQRERLLVLVPHQELFWFHRDSVLPIALIAVSTLLLALMIAMHLARKTANRVSRLQALFADLAQGHQREVPIVGTNDEIQDLMRSANELSQRLNLLQNHLKRAERLELLGQLSGGLAHQLRNSITAARMAIDLHAQSCPGDADNMLQTARSQLELTEEQVLAVLSLRHTTADEHSSETIRLSDLVEEVRRLLTPQCLHWKTRLSVCNRLKHSSVQVRSVRAIKGAILNLVMNAIDAAGTDGHVSIELKESAGAVTICIVDNGPGFDNTAGDLTAAFQTTKPQGIGLGLTIALHAVRQEGGNLTIERINGQTVVSIILPADARIPMESTA